MQAKGSLRWAAGVRSARIILESDAYSPLSDNNNNRHVKSDVPSSNNEARIFIGSVLHIAFPLLYCFFCSTANYCKMCVGCGEGQEVGSGVRGAEEIWSATGLGGLHLKN